MAKSPLETAAQNWAGRIAQAQRAGIPLEKIKPIAKYDIEKVIRGGTGMNNTEANLAIIASGFGKNVIQDPKPKTGLLDVIGNIPSDVTGIIKGFIPGMVSWAANLPKNLGDVHLTSEWHSPKAALQNLAGHQLTGILPGVHTASAIASGDTKTLAQHPVGTLLDVAPYIAGAAGAASRVATGGVAAEEGSAMAALQEGRLTSPVKAAARIIPAGKGMTIAERTGELAQRLGIDHITRELSRSSSIISRKSGKELGTVIDELVKQDPELTPERASQLHDIATGVDYAKGGKPYSPLDPAITPQEHNLIRWVRDMNDIHLQRGLKEGTHLMVSVEGKSYPYPITNYIAKRFQTIQNIGKQIVAEKNPEKVAQLQQRLIGKQKELAKAVHTPTGLPAQLHDFTEAKVRAQLEQHVRTAYQGESMQQALRTIQESSSWQDFANTVGTHEFQRILHSSMNEALELSKNGFDPLWLHHVPVGRYESGVIAPKPLSERYVSSETVRSRALNFSPHEHDLAIALIDSAREQLAADASREMVNKYLKPLSVKVSDIKQQAREALRSQHEGNPNSLRRATQLELQTKFRAYDPNSPFTWKTINDARDTDLAITKPVADNIDHILSADKKLQVQGKWDKTLKVYKFSVLTGPRHIVHVAIGGMAFMMMRDPGAITQIPRAIEWVKKGEVPPEVPTRLYEGMGTENLYRPKTDAVHGIAAGKTAGRLLMSIPNGMKHFEEWSANVQRAAVYLDKAKSGMDVETAAREAAKTFVQLDDMVPLERVISKNIMPFYAFTRHLFRYLFTLPVDHPIRTAILSRFAEQEQADWKSGLPQKYQQLFFIGGGDNVTGVDFKAINPFRSFGNDFSLAGFAAALNPAAQVGLELMGVNPLSATPELYPQISYDTQTGTLQAGRPHSGDWPAVVAETFLPPTQALDHFIGFSDRMKNLRKSSPESYRRQLFSALNLPFDFAHVNKSLIKSKTEIARYQAAQKAVSLGTLGGDFSQAKRYNVVPYQGQLVNPSQLATVWDQLQQQLSGGVNPKAVMKPPKRTKKRPA